MNRLVSATWLCSLAAGLMTVVGCGGDARPTGTVSGKVTLDGSTYSDASVVFLGVESGQASSANIESDGTFRLPDPLPVGEYVVYLAPKAAEDPAAEPAPVTIDQSVPEKYWNEADSDIHVDIQEGKNEVAVELKTSG